MFARLA